MQDKYSLQQLMDRIQDNWPDVHSVENEIIIALIRLNDLVTEKCKENLLPYDLTQAGFEVLITLRSLPAPRELSPTELFRAILITSGGMTKVLKSLEQKGLIERIDNPDDKRSKLVRLTDTGAQMAEQTMAAIQQGDRQLLHSGFQQAELKTLRDSLINAVKKLEMPNRS